MKLIFTLATCALLATTSGAAADDGACAECGCCSRKRVCRLVCEEKEIKIDKWKCECEHFCVPGPSHPCGQKCECDGSTKSGLWCFKLWNPSQCASVHTRKVLIKDHVTKKVPSYRWVVEEVCDECGCAACAEGCVPADPSTVKSDEATADAEIEPNTNDGRFNGARRLPHSSRGEE